MSIAARTRRFRRGQRRRAVFSALLALVASASWSFGGAGDLQPRFGSDPAVAEGPAPAFAPPRSSAGQTDPDFRTADVTDATPMVSGRSTTVRSMAAQSAAVRSAAERQVSGPAVETSGSAADQAPWPSAAWTAPRVLRAIADGSAAATRAPPLA